MDFLSFLILFALLSLTSSFAIIGFYVVTRGKKVQMPNGDYKTVGKIFKGWSLFWEKKIGIRKLYFSGEPLQQIYESIKSINGEFAHRLSLSEDSEMLIISKPLGKEGEQYIREITGTYTRIEANKLFLYMEEPEYYWPEFIRYPLSQCPPCMASVGGTIIYWPIVIFSNNLFAWATYKDAAYVFFYLFFCIALSALNSMLHRIMALE